jgi:hypothetical protein
MCCEPCKVAALIRWLFTGVSSFVKLQKEINFDNMAKSVKKKSVKAASSAFHSIMAASVKGNPKPAIKKKTPKTK